MALSAGATDVRDRPLPVAGFKGTPEAIERQWYEEVYCGRGDSMAQLTWRAVLIGSCLGGVLSLTNLYIGLPTDPADVVVRNEGARELLAR
jgi:hypothetical protein